MANLEHVERLKQGVKEWNGWRDDHADVRPDLSEADLRGINLNHAKLIKDEHPEVRPDLSEANLCGADLRAAHLNHAKLNGANLSHADLSEVVRREVTEVIVP